MKILVLSDSHREMENMHKAVLRENPDMIFHLGDHYKDAKLLHSEFPDIPMHAVRGNCDYGSQNTEQLLTIENTRIFLCHGHLYHVKYEYLTLEYAAREKDADIVLFGHTHRSFYTENDGLHMLNPGSIGEPRDPVGPTYGLIFLEKGQIFIRIIPLYS